MIDRRNFIEKSLLSAGGILLSKFVFSNSQIKMMEKELIFIPKVIFFDVNETLLDLKPLKDKVAILLDGKKELVNLWFTTMLQYSLVSTVGGKYEDFGDIGLATLQMVAANNNISISKEKGKETLKTILDLPAHPDVKDALTQLKEAGYSMVTLTNSSNKALEDQMTNSDLKKFFQHLLSIEEVGLYKPHKNVYEWAARKMGIAPQDCMLVAAHGWDIAGAKWAGWRTAFISRTGQQIYPLAEKPDMTGSNLKEIAAQLIVLKK